MNIKIESFWNNANKIQRREFIDSIGLNSYISEDKWHNIPEVWRTTIVNCIKTWPDTANILRGF